VIKIIYTPRFVREFSKLDSAIQVEAHEKIKLFQDPQNHKGLKVHKLHGPLKNFLSFSANYQYRVVFSFLSKNEVVLLMIGNHDVYK